MVGIVIVSHSNALAQALQALAREAAPKANITFAGGIDEGKQFGTDAVAIMEAIQSLYSDDGVLIFMDMGSAVLSAQTAIELLGPDMKVHLSAAPIVEGAILASILASTGATLQSIIEELEASLLPKESQLCDTVQAAKKPQQQTTKTATKEKQALQIPEDAIIQEHHITLKHGIHARPAAQIVTTFSDIDAEVYLSKDDGKAVSSSSFNNIVVLGIGCGDIMKSYIWGREAARAGNVLRALLASIHNAEDYSANYSAEDAQSATEEQLTPPREFLCISKGLAIGEALHLQSLEPRIPRKHCDNTSEELIYFDDALRASITQLETEKNSADTPVLQDILSMHLCMIQDKVSIQKAKSNIIDKHYSSEYAWWTACNEIAAEYKQMQSSYLQERAVDVLDLGWRFLSNCPKAEMQNIITIERPSVLFVDALSPALASTLNPEVAQGIVSHSDSQNSHAAIIIRSRGIPMLSNFPNMKEIKNGSAVILDAEDAENVQLIINPEKSVYAQYRKLLEEKQAQEKLLRKQALALAYTQDTIHIACYANVGELSDINNIHKEGADGVGLFRTEFLFLNKAQAPSEEEQYQIFCKALNELAGKPIVIRTFDIGGDKNIPYLHLPSEDNPFLGLRGIRLALQERELFRAQIRAILRAATHAPIKIMLPMIVDEAEILQAKEIIADVGKDLEQKNMNAEYSIGIMIETPAAVQRAGILAEHADFFSIGSNDLTQYIMAAERGNTTVNYLYNSYHPAVLNALHQSVIAAKEHDIAISICGEFASELEALPILIGMGIDTVSMNLPRIPYIKKVIQLLSYKECRDFTMNILQDRSKKGVRARVQEFLANHNI